MARTEIMWIENKSSNGLVGPARIGRVTFSKSGKSLHYGGMHLKSLKGGGFKSNYADSESEDQYWITECRKDGRNALYNTEVEIDEDVREEYWIKIRDLPDKVAVRGFRAQGKY